MKNVYKPMLYQTEMVQAILDNSKKMTRRTKGLEQVNTDYIPWEFTGFCSNPNDENDKSKGAIFKCWNDTWFWVKCPWQISDILWVRESFFPKEINEEPPGTLAHYKASDSFAVEKWKPSIHMPKEVCRLFLRVVSVNVERLQSISEEDSIAEGCSQYGPFGEYKGSLHPNGGGTRFSAYSKAVRAFQCVWESINGVDSWKSNPWIWVIEFERIDKPEDFLL